MRVLDLLELRSLTRLATVGALGLLAAGCSQNMARFSGTPTPPRTIASAGAPSEYTAAVPTTRIDRQSLTPIAGLPSASLPSASARPYPSASARPLAARPIGVQPLAAQPLGAQPLAVQPLASAPLASTGSAQSRPDWRAPGGSRVTAMPGDTVEVFSRRYGVSPAAIRQANGLGAGGQPAQYAQILIPADNAKPMAASRPIPAVAASAAPRAPRTTKGGSHVVTSGETLTAIGRRYDVPVREIAAANNVSTQLRVRIGQRLTIPGVSATEMARKDEQPAQRSAEPQVAMASGPSAAEELDSSALASADEPSSSEEDTAAAGPNVAARPSETSTLQPAAYAPPASTQRLGVDTETTKPEPARLSASSFRWPVRGRVIGEFGTTEGGQRNDGINLAVPEGSPVKAAENGVVVYAGSELKGYGNLVLVRHEGDFVTAYAHNSELMVKRGDTVRRGQIISKAGQTGNVTSPQVHFEIRKGAKPVDPKDYLSGS